MEEIRKYLMDEKKRPHDDDKTNAEVKADIANLEKRVLRIIEDFLIKNRSLAININVKTVEGNPQSTVERLDFITDVRVRKTNRLEKERFGVTDGRCNPL